MPKKKKSKKKSSTKGESNLMSKLKSMQTGWKKGKPRKSGFPIPDDDYAAEIMSAVIEEARSSGRLQIHYVLKATEGDYEGKEFAKYAGLETDDNLEFAMGDLETLELEIPADIKDLGPVLEEAVGLAVDVTVRTSDSFTNVDFNELLEEGDDEDEEEDEDEEDKDDEGDEDEGPEESDDEDEGDEEEDAEVEEGEENDWPTVEEIKKLKKKDLTALAKELKIKTKKFTKDGKLNTRKLAQACIDDIYEEE